jgi:hypothetical protein
MKTKHVLLIVGLLSAAVILSITMPSLNDKGATLQNQPNPWDFPTAKELRQDGIRIGGSMLEDIHVNREGEGIRVVVSKEFLSKKPEGFLPTVGMMNHTEVMSEERYTEFLEAIHMTIEDHQHGETDFDHPQESSHSETDFSR